MLCGITAGTEEPVGQEAENFTDQEEHEMKVQNNITIFTGNTQNNVQAESARVNQTDKSSGGQKSKTIYAGNLLTEVPLRDRIQQRRAQAQERAMKIVGEAWGGDRKIDEEIGRSKERLKMLREEIGEAQDNVKSLTESQEALSKSYGIEADSQEQQDLDLLAKAQASKHISSGVKELSEEEQERLAEISKGERTEYQKRWLELNEQSWTSRDTIFRNKLKVEVENAVIRGIREERRKSHEMVNAQGQAEDVMEAARDEIIGMVTDAAKDHIDEEQEKREEEAEAIKEKKEEQEEILEERKEKEDELEELMEDMPVDEATNLDSIQKEIQKEIQDVVNKMNLVAEDIKGAKVDEML